jgi:hypothetical protein
VGKNPGGGGGGPCKQNLRCLVVKYQVKRDVVLLEKPGFLKSG